MHKLKLKALQDRCKEAGLSTTGKRKELIERLEANEFHTINNSELLSRVRQLEDTLAGLQARDELSDESLAEFSPPMRSSPRKNGVIQYNQNLGTAAAVADTPLGYTVSTARCPTATVSQAFGAKATVSTAFGPMTSVSTAFGPTSYVSSVCGSTASTATAYGLAVSAATACGPTPILSTVRGANATASTAYGQTAATSSAYRQTASMPIYGGQTVNPGVRFDIPSPNVQMHNTAPQNTGFYTSMPFTNVFYPQSTIPVTANYVPGLQPMGLQPATSMNFGQATTPIMGIKDIVEILPEYDPMDDASLSSSQFVQRVQTLKNAYGWRDDILIMAVQRKFKSHAKLWADAKKDVFVTWQQLADELVATFPFDDNPVTVHAKMANVKRGVDETPHAYYYKMLAMGIKYGLAEKAIARHIINGINEPDLQKKISNEYQQCNELLRDIDTYCRHNDIKKPYEKAFDKPKSFKVMAKPPQERNNSEIRYRCYNCQKYGHISAKCPEPQKSERCGNCNKVGHKTNECRKGVRTSVSNVKAIEKEKREIMKSIVVNGVMIEAFVDPGSAFTLVRASLAEKLGELSKCSTYLSGFGGGTYLCETKVPVQIKIDECISEIDLLVVADKLLEHDVLLGRDALCQQGKRVVIIDKDCWVENIENVATLSSHLTAEDRVQLKKLLSENRNCFAENTTELGICKIAKMEIKLTTDKPIKSKPYRIPFAQREKVAEILDELLRANIIRKSESPYASPVVVVPKKNGELRLCVDYRQLNRITEKIPFPMPIIEEQMALLAGSKYYTALDLRMGYHQIAIEENSKPYTAFVTVDGHYEYNCMPFGLVNAPATFQAIMNTLAAKMDRGEILTYLDDVILPSRNVEEGLTRLRKFLKILQEVGLTLRLDKCKFLQSEITYLGHVINAEGITPGDHKITAVRNFQVPKDVTEVRRFLGLTGFFRKFIQDYALISKPLTMLLHKSNLNKFQWGVKQQEAFDKLVEKLCDKPVLTLYDYNAYHEVHTDASSIGLAGVLLQSYDQKQWKPVFYFSRHCSEVESRYHAYELEVLAAVETLTRFRVYLLGKHFRLITDCSALAKVRDGKELLPKIARWYMKLLEYNFEAVHRPAARLSHVDALSRAPVEAPAEVTTAGFVAKIELNQNDWLLTMQLQDKKLAEIIDVLNGKRSSEQEVQLKADYQLKNSRLYRKDNGLKFVVPTAVRWRIVKHCHDDAGHFSLEKTIARIRQYYWFPRIRKYVREYLDACVECCFNKAKGGKSEGRMYYDEIEPIPFGTIHIDHLGPFIKSSRGMTHILAISDSFSKYLVVKAVRSVKSNPVIVALNELTSYFGLPKRIVTDRGTAFTSKVFADYCNFNNIQHIQTAVRTPRANGQVERANQLILTYLRTSTENPRHWDQMVREMQWTVNSQQNATTGFTPNELVFDFRLRDVLQNRIIAAIQEDMPLEEDQTINEKREVAAQRIMAERERWKTRFDEKHQQPTVFEVDDLVVIAHEPAATGESRKLASKYRGPYIVTKVLGKDRYVIGDIPGIQVTQRQFDSVYSSDKMKRWCSNSPELDAQSEDDDEDVLDASLEDEPVSA